MTIVVDVRAARRADQSDIARVLSRAFIRDPVFSWMLPTESRRGVGLVHLFETMARWQHQDPGALEVGCDRDGTIRAAAMWDPPDRWRTSPFIDLVMMPGMARAFGTKIFAAGRVAEVMKQHHPGEPHWYLGLLGSEPAVRGRGYGAALLRSRLDRCDEAHAPAYLESSNPVNIGYYQRFGFEVVRELPLPGGCPPIWPMWRSPR